MIEHDSYDEVEKIVVENVLKIISWHSCDPETEENIVGAGEGGETNFQREGKIKN